MNRPFDSSIVRGTVVAAVAVLLALNYLYADLARLEQTARREVHAQSDGAPVPPTGLIRSSLLNFDTLAADLVWIRAVLYYGRKRAKRHEPEQLYDYATTVADLDPYFFPVYRWFSHSYLATRYPPSPDDLNRVNSFLERGMKHFPADYRLPRTAGLNYIGYPSDTRSTRQRIRELERAIDYLERASKFRGAPETLALTVANLYQRRRQLTSRLEDDRPGEEQPATGMTDEQIDFFVDMYFTVDSTRTRKKIRRYLERAEGGRRALLRRGRKYAERLRRERRRRLNYLPLGLWSTAIRTP